METTQTLNDYEERVSVLSCYLGATTEEARKLYNDDTRDVLTFKERLVAEDLEFLPYQEVGGYRIVDKR